MKKGNSCMVNRKVQGVIMIAVGAGLFLAVVGYAFPKVIFAALGLFLMSYGLHLFGKPTVLEYAQKFFNALK